MKPTIDVSDLGPLAAYVLSRPAGWQAGLLITDGAREVAAIVPVSVLEEHEQRRARLGRALDRVQEATAGADPVELDAAIAEAVAEVRATPRPGRAHPRPPGEAP